MGNCDYCGGGIHSSEDLFVFEAEDCDEMHYHKWCYEESEEG